MTDAKRAFVLADKLKAVPFDGRQPFLDAPERYRQEVHGLPMTQIDSIVGGHQPRLRDYSRASWSFGVFDLRRCVVWPRMGERSWAVGSPVAVAELFKDREPADSRIWNMKRFADVFASRLPIIILDRGTEVRIDDGSHRAVAMALVGVTQVSAWIAVLSGEPDGPANGSQPIRSATNRTSSAAGSRR
ncbi:MAG TPA: hypothetical protein VMP01_22415 [Pirellulaceae bacterium]|nr:hypothetical protein [Pirellulaceae bacterium]